jgi:hypothetical protein
MIELTRTVTTFYVDPDGDESILDTEVEDVTPYVEDDATPADVADAIVGEVLSDRPTSVVTEGSGNVLRVREAMSTCVVRVDGLQCEGASECVWEIRCDMSGVLHDVEKRIGAELA